MTNGLVKVGSSFFIEFLFKSPHINTIYFRKEREFMTTSSDFKAFLNNLKIKNAGQISNRYGTITRALNRKFRGTESKTDNTLQVGSYGRFTGIKGISDLDMLYIMPNALWTNYSNDPSALLDTVKSQIETVYPTTKINKDRYVIVATIKQHKIEIVPVFQLPNKSFKLPDTYNGGGWKIADYKAELKAIKDKNEERNGNLRLLAKMVRAWKSHNNIQISGFLIDTLCYNFLKNTPKYDQHSFGKYDELVRDFFYFLEYQTPKAYYLAPGSNSQALVTKPKLLQQNAIKAREDCHNAIVARQKEQFPKCTQLYKGVFGRNFPRPIQENDHSTEQFIEHSFDLELNYKIKIDCEIKEDLITQLLSRFLVTNERIKPQRKLTFKADNIDIPGDFELKWKILNQGDLAINKGELRGQILDDDGTRSRTETSSFYGDHIVECYAIKNNIVVAMDQMEVPISHG
jgi:hypothetical protein